MFNKKIKFYINKMIYYWIPLISNLPSGIQLMNNLPETKEKKEKGTAM